MWNGPKSEENCEMFAQSYAAFSLWTMTVKYEEYKKLWQEEALSYVTTRQSLIP
jgi:hypothetical protein